MNIQVNCVPNIVAILDEGPLVSCTPIWCICRWDGRSACLLTWGRWRCPCGSGRAAGRATPSGRDGWGALRICRMTRVAQCHRWSHEAKRMEAVWRRRNQLGHQVHTDVAGALRFTIIPPVLAVLPAHFVLAELLQHMRGWVICEVLHSIHGFVHCWDIFHPSLLFVLVMVQDVVDATQACPGRTDQEHIHI